jgi:hypothetical protein
MLVDAKELYASTEARANTVIEREEVLVVRVRAVAERERMVVELEEKLQECHTPFREIGNEASIRVPRMFKSHAWQQYDKQMQCY